MRRAAKTDANQAEIVAALREIGATVTSTAAVGKGFPDLAVGWRDMTFLLEIKDSGKPPSKRKLTADEADWHAAWRGHAAVVENVKQAIEAIGG
jgi:Holliday junction resolvase